MEGLLLTLSLSLSDINTHTHTHTNILTLTHRYEGTGRSLSLKLMKSIRTQSVSSSETDPSPSVGLSSTGRVLREISLTEPIRYASGDAVERWLNDLLCLDASIPPSVKSTCPHPSACELFHVSRDTLFSCHRTSERFLHHMMALYVSSHYKNTPNDLMLMSDAPLHHLFVLLAPVDPSAGPSKAIPEILTVLQVCLEGGIAKQTVQAELGSGKRPAGDLIPWTIAQQYQDYDFASLSGARVVRIATHPSYQGMGYGTRALALLEDYYAGKIFSVTEEEEDSADGERAGDSAKKSNEEEGDLSSETIAPRTHLPPLLQSLHERRPDPIHWLGVSFGLTPPLCKFWGAAGYVPLYVRLTSNDVTGEHTCIMLKTIAHKGDLLSAEGAVDPDRKWLSSFSADFRCRFLSLLSFEFRRFPPSLALRILQQCGDSVDADSDSQYGKPLSASDLHSLLSTYDIRRLDSYARNLLDYHVVLDIVPQLARLHFQKRFGSVSLSHVQAAILAAVGLQHKTVDEAAVELALQPNQVCVCVCCLRCGLFAYFFSLIILSLFYCLSCDFKIVFLLSTHFNAILYDNSHPSLSPSHSPRC